jgi:hypothetical protein
MCWPPRAIHAGHANIEQHGIRLFALGMFEGVHAVVGLAHHLQCQALAAIFQHLAKTAASGRLVIYDEQAQGGG